MPCGFTWQQPNNYNASTEVSCFLLLFLLMVSTQSISMLKRRKNSSGNKAISHGEGARHLVINNIEELRTEQFPPLQLAKM